MFCCCRDTITSLTLFIDIHSLTLNNKEPHDSTHYYENYATVTLSSYLWCLCVSVQDGGGSATRSLMIRVDGLTAGADVALVAVEEAVSDPDVRPRSRVA